MAIIFFALFFAAIYSVGKGAEAVGNSFKGHRDQYARNHPNAPKAAAAAAALGRMAAATRHGPVGVFAGMREGWRLGWAHGEEVYTNRYAPVPPETPDRRRRRRDVTEPDPAPADQTPTDNPTPAATNNPPQRPRPRPRPAQGADRPPLRVVPPMDEREPIPAHPDYLPSANPVNPNLDLPLPRGEQQPTTTSNAGGPAQMSSVEITSPETLLAALKAIHARATSELQDAQVAAARARQEKAHIELLVAQAQALQLAKTHVDIVAALVDPAAAAVRAHEAGVAAADKKATDAADAVRMAAHHIQLQGQGAAGEFYQGASTGS